MADTDPFADLGSNDPFTDLVPKADVRVMAYGPVVGEHHHDAMYGPQGNALQPYDVAVSPNLGLNLGDWIEVNGQARRVADWSYRKPGVPTKDTVEIRDEGDQGHGTINRVNLSDEEIQKRIGAIPPEALIAGDRTATAERVASQPADVKGDPFADLIPKEGEKAPAHERDPFSDIGPTPTPGIPDTKDSQLSQVPPDVTGPTPPPQAAAEPEPIELPTPTQSEGLPQYGALKSGQVVMPQDPTLMAEYAKRRGIPQDQVLDYPLIPAEVMPPYLIAKGAEAVLPQNPATQIYEGEMKGVADLMSGFMSPANLGMLATGGLMGKLATRLVASAFSAQAAAKMPEAWKRFNETDNPQEKTRIAIGVIAGIGLPLLAWAHRSPKIQKQIQSDIAKTTAELPPQQTTKVPPPEDYQPQPQANAMAPAPRPEPQIPEPASFSVDMPTDTFGSEHTPVANAVIGMGGVLSKSAAAKSKRLAGNAEQWDGAPRMSHPTHNKIYNPSGEMPDTTANALYDAGLISDPSADTMWDALDKESKAARSTLKAQRGEAQGAAASLKEKAGQTQAFIKAEQQAWQSGAPAVPVKDLQVGDTVTVRGEKLKVTDIDPDTYDVTLEDGRQFGVQTVSDNTVIYGEHESSYAVKPESSVANQIKAGKGYIHVNIRGNELDLSKPLTGWVLPAESGDFPNAMNTKYGRAGRQAVFVPKEWVNSTRDRPPKIKEGFVPNQSQIGVIKPQDIRPSGTVNWESVFSGEAKSAPEFSETKGEAPPVEPPPEPPAPPSQPPTGAAPPSGDMPDHTLSEIVNPVKGSGRFVRSYRIDKELGDKMEAIGNAKEAGALRAEIDSRNVLGELSPLQEKNLGRVLLSDRLKLENPAHPQVLPDSEIRRIESDPAIAKALDIYRKTVEPEVEAWHKRGGVTEESIAEKRGKYITLVPKTDELLSDRLPGFSSTRRLSRTTRFAKAASGEAAQYDTDLRNILRESYGGAIRAAHVREFYQMAKAKEVASTSKVYTPSGWKNIVQYEDLPPELAYDLNNATKTELPPVGGAKLLRGIQSTVTGAALTLNPPELINHMRRQLNLVAAKAPVGMGIMARLEALAPYFGPKIGAFKRAVMTDANSPEFQATLTRIFDAGGGSTRSFGEAYGSKIPGLKQAKEFSNRLLFGIPKGKGVMGWDLRMRVQLENIREAVEGNRDPQRIRENANQIGEYGRHNSWLTRVVKAVNPYGGTTVAMRLTELKTAVGLSGFKGQPMSRATRLNAETFLRGTGGTILALATSNYLLSGKWPWENDKGHETDLNTGHRDKDGKTIYVKLRAIAPELARPVATVSLPELSRETTAQHPQYGVAAATGPTNQLLSLLSGPAQNAALTYATGYVPYMLKRPGEAMEPLDIARLTANERNAGRSRFVKQLKMGTLGINPFGEAFGDRFKLEVPGAMGYAEEPIKGVRPFGRIFSSSYERAGGGSVAPPPPPPPAPPPPPP
jgi:hypothetical protein